MMTARIVMSGEGYYRMSPRAALARYWQLNRCFWCGTLRPPPPPAPCVPGVKHCATPVSLLSPRLATAVCLTAAGCLLGAADAAAHAPLNADAVGLLIWAVSSPATYTT